MSSMTNPPTVGFVGSRALWHAMAELALAAGAPVLIFGDETPKAPTTKAKTNGKSPKSSAKANAKANAKAQATSEWPKGVKAAKSVKQLCEECPVIYLGSPTDGARAVLQSMGPHLRPDHMIVHHTRGLEDHGEKPPFYRVSEIVRQECCVKKIAVIAGAVRPDELRQGMPSACVIASPYRDVVHKVRAVFGSPVFHIYETEDLVGAELGMALTPAYAIAIGLVQGMGFGAGTTGFIATRAVSEMARFSAPMRGEPATFAGLSGIGELLTAALRPDHPFVELGRTRVKGKDAPLENPAPELREGLTSLRLAAAFARNNAIFTPILLGVDAVIHEGRPIAEVARHLLAVGTGHEKEIRIDEAVRSEAWRLAPRGGAGKN
ncbi:hypothetical protein KDL45_12135 [bacterium]|nr:hypothetical protein [bacterium]